MAGYLQQYGNNYRLALAAYNAGAGSVAQYGGVPPFQETQTYVASILGDKGAQEGKMAGPVDDINAQLKRLQEQIEKAERDAESADIDVSYPAQKALVSLNREYRQLLATAVSANKRPTDTSNLDVVKDPRTGQPVKYRDPVTGQLIDLPDKVAPSMYVNRQRSDPGDSTTGPSQWNERVPVVDTRMNGRQLWGLPEGGTQYEMIQEFPDTSASSDGVGWANLAQRKQEFDQKMAWDRTLAEMKAKQDQEQADRSLQGQLYSHINNIWAQNLPRMGDPSQTYFAGAGPGGPLETLFKQGGSTYDPNQGKIAWQNFDPNAAWKQAAGMVRR